MMIIRFDSYLLKEELDKIYTYIEEHSTDFNLKVGMNYAIDVSNIIGRTASIDIEVI